MARRSVSAWPAGPSVCGIVLNFTTAIQPETRPDPLLRRLAAPLRRRGRRDGNNFSGSSLGKRSKDATGVFDGLGSGQQLGKVVPVSPPK